MQLTWLLDITGIPQNWRVLEGHSVNTFVLVNKEGKETLVKMHFFPKGGAKFMNDEEAQMVGAENMRHSHATLGAPRYLLLCAAVSQCLENKGVILAEQRCCICDPVRIGTYGRRLFVDFARAGSSARLTLGSLILCDC